MPDIECLDSPQTCNGLERVASMLSGLRLK